MEDRFFSTGVPLSQLKEWLGEPLGTACGGDDTISVRVIHVRAGVAQEIAPSGAKVLTWDCIGFEKTYRAILETASRAPESDRDSVVQALATASQMHLLSQCRAERIHENLWVVRHQCLKHLYSLRH